MTYKRQTIIFWYAENKLNYIIYLRNIELNFQREVKAKKYLAFWQITFHLDFLTW